MAYPLDSQGRRFEDSLSRFLWDSDGPPQDTPPRDWTTSKVPDLAIRALQKHGLGIVPSGARQADGPTLTSKEIISRVVAGLGIPVPLADRPRESGTVDDAEVARRALLSLGVNPATGTPSGAIVAQAEIASRALRNHGVNPADLPAQSTGRSYTFQEVATAALRRLSVVDALTAPSVADQAEAEVHALAAHDMLSGLDYVDWPSDAIPGAVFEAYVTLTANVAGPSFGIKAGDASAAQEMVRIQSLSGPVAQARALLRVLPVHEAFVAEGLADWPADAIPASVADAYVTMVSAAIAPVYGKPADAAARGEAMAQVRRVLLSGARGQAFAQPKVASAHDALIRAGVVDWPLVAVPAAFAEDYAALVAAMLAPTYGQQRQDPTEAVVTKLRAAGLLRQKEQRVSEKVRGIYEELNALGVATWNYDQTPAAMADAIVTTVTGLMSGEAGAQDAGYKRIRRVAMAGPYGQRVAERYVRTVHYDLEASEKARWTLVDIPRWAEEPYVLLAATMLAPDLEVVANPEWPMAAMRSILVNTVLPTSGGPVRAMYY